MGTGKASRSLLPLLREIRACRICELHLPDGPRPVVQAGRGARLLIAGQAPGRRVHDSGVPWDDPSGDRLRQWLGISREQFYDPELVALVPMGFCYPGKGKSGDLPPRPECAQTWHARLLRALPNIGTTLVIGQYAQAYHLGDRRKTALTDTVRAWRDYAPDVIPLPHPSPRNVAWFVRNPWFADELLPVVRDRIAQLLLAARQRSSF